MRSTTASRHTLSSIESCVVQQHTLVKNPLFRFEERPDYLDALYEDCIASYAGKKSINIYNHRQDEMIESTVPVTQVEEVSYQVKLILEEMARNDLEEMGKGRVMLRYDLLPDALKLDNNKLEILDELKRASALSSHVARYGAPEFIPIGDRSAFMLSNTGTPMVKVNTESNLVGSVTEIQRSRDTISSSVDSENLNELR